MSVRVHLDLVRESSGTPQTPAPVTTAGGTAQVGAGWRVGWAVAPAPLTNRLRRASTALGSAPAAPLQSAGHCHNPIFHCVHTGSTSSCSTNPRENTGRRQKSGGRAEKSSSSQGPVRRFGVEALLGFPEAFFRDEVWPKFTERLAVLLAGLRDVPPQ